MSRNLKSSTSAAKGKKAGTRKVGKKKPGNNGDPGNCSQLQIKIRLDKADNLAAIWAVLPDGSRVRGKLLFQSKKHNLCCICDPFGCVQC
jgi:hypothetical protein